MQSLSLKTGKGGMKEALQKAAAIKPQIVLVFGAPEIFADRGAVSDACQPLQDIHVMGCTTAGEISSEGASEDSCAILAIRFAHTAVKVAASQLATHDASRGAGRNIGESLKESGLRGIFALIPGTSVDGSAFAAGIAQAAGAGVTVAGGLAGDGMGFKNTFTMLNGMVFPNLAVAFGLFGDKVTMKSTTGCGWKPFGLMRRVTKSAGNILYEIDRKPAAALYQRYLGAEAAKGLPASGLIYPFALMTEDGRDLGIVRMPSGVAAEGGIVMTGSVPQGSLLRLMYADPDALFDGAAAAASAAGQAKGGSAALIVNCAGRKAALGRDAGDEVEAALKALGRPACAGFYAYGDIAPTLSGAPDVFSQSMTITHIMEEAA